MGVPRMSTSPSASESSTFAPHRPPKMARSSRKPSIKGMQQPLRRPLGKPNGCPRARQRIASRGATLRCAPPAKRLPKAALSTSSSSPPHRRTPSISKITSPGRRPGWPGTSSMLLTKKPYASTSKSNPAPCSSSTLRTTSRHSPWTFSSLSLPLPLHLQPSLSSRFQPLAAIDAYSRANFAGCSRAAAWSADCSRTQKRCTWAAVPPPPEAGTALQW
mmetsp:Transcript_121617/g.389133  ORF Transcript_121617/g.389133 Transcript_121617/m.389133 type:complete len:218 (+) Transcript_121617:268-921(+)